MTSDKYRMEWLPEFDSTNLVGTWFHSYLSDEDFAAAKLKWQGVVVAQPNESMCLVQTFDWVTGSRSVQRLVNIVDMIHWRFFDTSSDMNYEYEEDVVPKQQAQKVNGNRSKKITKPTI